MRYILISYEEEKYWIEMDGNNFAIRQIVFSDGEYHISCLEDCLSEGQIREEELEGEIINISSTDFEKVWSMLLEKYKMKWEGIKRDHKIDDYVIGTFFELLSTRFYLYGGGLYDSLH